MLNIWYRTIYLYAPDFCVAVRLILWSVFHMRIKH